MRKHSYNCLEISLFFLLFAYWSQHVHIMRSLSTCRSVDLILFLWYKCSTILQQNSVLNVLQCQWIWVAQIVVESHHRDKDRAKTSNSRIAISRFPLFSSPQEQGGAYSEASLCPCSQLPLRCTSAGLAITFP